MCLFFCWVESMTDAELIAFEEKLEAAIEVTTETNSIFRTINSDDPVLKTRERVVVQLQGQLNMLRGFDVIELGA